MVTLTREAGRYWDSCIACQPGLFEASGLSRDILRLYSGSGSLVKGIERHNRIGALQKVLSCQQLAECYPSLAGPCEAGEIAGGILVTGFTLGIHDFMLNLAGLLERHGVSFHWEHAVDRIEWAGPGQVVAGLRDGADEPIMADHYVLSPGAYGRGLLDGTETAHQIQGVVGVWVTIPNTGQALTNSMKLRREEHVTPDTNITVINDSSRGPVLVLGAGYGWTGANPENIDPTELTVLYDGIEDTARRFFPVAYRAASARGWLRETRRWCTRPWTATSLGVFDVYPAASGGRLIVTGGHNTGGFAQAPVVGEAVLAALRGVAHPMHAHYSVHRLEEDLRSRAQPG